MPCTISGTLKTGRGQPIGDAVITAAPATLPFFNLVSATWIVSQAQWPRTTTALDGTWSLTLPQGTTGESDPASQVWTLTLNGTDSWQGIVPAVNSVDFHALKNAWNWAYISKQPVTPGTAVQGPPGMNPRGTWGNTTTYAVNDVVFYQGATYIALAINGPSNGGAITPGTNSAVWQTVAQAGFIAVPAPANQVYAGPTSGGNATPAVRALVPADLPSATTATQGAAVKTATLLSDFASLAAALTALGSSNPGHLVIHQTVSACPAATIPANVTLEFRNGAKLQPAASATITHNGATIAPPVQIFDLSLGGTVRLAPTHHYEVWVEWFGARGDCNGSTGSGTDSTAGIQAAYNASTTGNSIVVRFAGGLYRVTATLSLLNSRAQYGVVSRGMGGRLSGIGLGTGTQILWDGPTCTFAPLPLTFKGNWLGGTYAVGDILRSLLDGNYYSCTLGVTGGTDPSTNPTHWSLTTAPVWSHGNLPQSTFSGTNNGRPWAANTAYAIAQVVLYSGHYYVALAAIDTTHSTTPDVDTANWSPADPLILALTRDSTWEGIGFGCVQGKTLHTAVCVEKDYAAGGTAFSCTKNRWRDCWFGTSGGSHVIYGLTIGLFGTTGNLDQMDFENCAFQWCDWASVAIPNTSGESKEHHFTDCEFVANSLGPTAPYAIWAQNASWTAENCHWYSFAQYAQILLASKEGILNIGHDCESCAGFLHATLSTGGTATFVGGRYTPDGVPAVTPASGSEYVWLQGGGSLLSLGTFWANALAPTMLFSFGNGTDGTFVNSTLSSVAPMAAGTNSYRVQYQQCSYYLDTAGHVTRMPHQIILNGSTSPSGAGWGTTNVPWSVSASTPTPLILTNNPPPSPTLSATSLTGGFLRGGSQYNYWWTYVTANGETLSPGVSQVVLAGSAGDGHVWQTDWTTVGLGPAGTTARKIYRQPATNFPITTLAAIANSGQPQVTLQAGQGAGWFVNDWMVLNNAGTKEAYPVIAVAGDVVTLSANLLNTYPIGSTANGNPVVLAGTIANNTATTFNDTALGAWASAGAPIADTSSIQHTQLGNLQLDAVTTTSATAGTNGAPPAQVVGYVDVLIGGVLRKIAYYGN